jgi:hypothetical protein
MKKKNLKGFFFSDYDFRIDDTSEAQIRALLVGRILFEEIDREPSGGPPGAPPGEGWTFGGYPYGIPPRETTMWYPHMLPTCKGSKKGFYRKLPAGYHHPYQGVALSGTL